MVFLPCLLANGVVLERSSASSLVIYVGSEVGSGSVHKNIRPRLDLLYCIVSFCAEQAKAANGVVVNVRPGCPKVSTPQQSRLAMLFTASLGSDLLYSFYLSLAVYVCVCVDLSFFPPWSGVVPVVCET